MNDHYILEGKTPKKVDLMTWARWFEAAIDNRRVGETIGNAPAGAYPRTRVSTMFLGLDHSFGDGSPLLFETMIFGGEHDGYQDRCTTWEEAEAMHKKACEIAGITQ